MFEASYNRVMVPIPVHIWEVIRQYPGLDLSWANKSDQNIHPLIQLTENQRSLSLAQPAFRLPDWDFEAKRSKFQRLNSDSY